MIDQDFGVFCCKTADCLLSPKIYFQEYGRGISNSTKVNLTTSSSVLQNVHDVFPTIQVSFDQ